MEWYYTFHLPMWYEYEKTNKQIWKKSNSLVIKSDFGAIIGKWLTMYSEWELLTKKDLLQYLRDTWCETNAQYLKPKKLHKSLINRLLDPKRLFFYAWYIVYPDRWITEPVEAKHEWIISLDVAKVLIHRQENSSEQFKASRLSKCANETEIPLRGILTCHNCKKKFVASWSSWRNKRYLYYTCKNKECETKNVSGSMIHEEFAKLLKEMMPCSEEADHFTLTSPHVRKLFGSISWWTLKKPMHRW